MSVKFTQNANGTTTIRIPKTEEVYDAADGALYFEATVENDELSAALKTKPAKSVAGEPIVDPAEAVVANWLSEDALARNQPVPAAIADASDSEPYKQTVEPVVVEPVVKPAPVKPASK
jgi:hypothetical protein